MKNAGKQFETSLQDSIKEARYYYLRLKDNAAWTQQGAESKFSAQNPYDNILYTPPLFWTLELKSTEGSSMSFYPFEYDDNGKEISAPYLKPKDTTSQKMLKAHQVKELIKANTYDGIIAGFIINFRERILKTKSTPNMVFFLHVKDFIELAKKKGRSSINIEDCKTHGVEIIGIKKKVHYKYDIQKFVNDAVKYYIEKSYITKDFLEKLNSRIQKLIELSEKKS